jgi:hypothetical protein
MTSLTRIVFAVTGLTLAVWSCAPCDPIPTSTFGLCHRADAGEMAPDASFVLEGTVGVFNSTCAVTVDGGAIDLQIIGTPSCGPGVGSGVAAPEKPVKCTIPPLPAGTYTVNSQPAVTLTLPTPADGGIRACP